MRRSSNTKKRLRPFRLAGQSVVLGLLLALLGCHGGYTVYRPAVVWNLDDETRLPQAKHSIPRSSVEGVSLFVTSTGLNRGEDLGLRIPTVRVDLRIKNDSPTKGFVLLCQEATLEVKGHGRVGRPFAVSESQTVKTLAVPPRQEVTVQLRFELPEGTEPDGIEGFTFRGPSRFDQREYILLSRFTRP